MIWLARLTANYCLAPLGIVLSVGIAAAQAQPVLERVEQLLRTQLKAGPPAAEPGYLGLIGDEAADAGRGVRVVEVFANGPAAVAGVANGDLITTINGQQIAAMDDMAKLLEGKTAGTRLTMSIVRGGTARNLTVTLGRRPATPPAATEELPIPATPPTPAPAAAGGRLGVRTIAVTEEVRRQAGLVSANGAHVVSVSPGSPAGRAWHSSWRGHHGRQRHGGRHSGSVGGDHSCGRQASGSDLHGSGRGQEWRLELAVATDPSAPQSRTVARPTQPTPAAPPTPAPSKPVAPPPKPNPPPSPAAESAPPELPPGEVSLGERVNVLETRQAQLLERIETLEAEIARLKAAQAEPPK